MYAELATSFMPGSLSACPASVRTVDGSMLQSQAAQALPLFDQGLSGGRASCCVDEAMSGLQRFSTSSSEYGLQPISSFVEHKPSVTVAIPLFRTSQFSLLDSSQLHRQVTMQTRLQGHQVPLPGVLIKPCEQATSAFIGVR